MSRSTSARSTDKLAMGLLATAIILIALGWYALLLVFLGFLIVLAVFERGA